LRVGAKTTPKKTIRIFGTLTGRDSVVFEVSQSACVFSLLQYGPSVSKYRQPYYSKLSLNPPSDRPCALRVGKSRGSFLKVSVLPFLTIALPPRPQTPYIPPIPTTEAAPGDYRFRKGRQLISLSTLSRRHGRDSIGLLSKAYS